MHIVIDGTPAINDIRAIQRYAWNLLSQIAVLESENEYTALYLGAAGIGDDKFPGFPSSRIKSIRSTTPGRLLNLFWKFSSFPNVEYMVKRKFDIFHFLGGSAYIPVGSGKTLTTMHGFAQQVVPEHMDKNLHRGVLAKLEKTISETDHFITVSETNKQELNKLWNVPMEKINAIPLGVGDEFRVIGEISNYEAAIRGRYHLGDKDFLLYVGAIEPHKNIQGIIEAYSLLDSSIKRRLNLVMVGAKTKYTESYREQARKSAISGNVIFVDYIQPGSEDLAILYNMAELFIFPTFYEGWASPPLEAMKCGTPAIVSDIPSLRESTGGAAEYCNPFVPDDISHKITKLLDDCEFRNEKTKKGLSFSSRFTWRLCAEKTIEVYQKS